MKKAALIFALIFFVSSCIKKENGLPNDATGNSGLAKTTLVDISYGSHVRQTYDIHLPAGRDSNTPVILMIHGGAWKAGQKEELNNYINIIKNKWSKVAIVNMNDIKAVIGQVINYQNDYQISTNMGIVGGSAGGQLTMIYAYKYNDYNNINCVGNIFCPSIINDWSWYDSNNLWLGYVGDVLSEYVGQTWDNNVYEGVSPYWNVTSNSQPTIAFHGSLDPIVPVYQSQWMHTKLNNLSVINEYHEYVAFHGFDNPQSQDVVSKMVTFFKNHID